MSVRRYTEKFESIVILGSRELGVVPAPAPVSIPVLMLAAIRGGVRGWLVQIVGWIGEVMGADIQMMKEGQH